MIPHEQQEHIEVMVLFRIISRRSWENLQAFHRACPGSVIEHLYAGLYVLTIPAGGAVEVAA